MRVLLVATNQESLPYPVAPLGAATVAAALRTAGHEVELLDLFFADDAAAAMTEAVTRFRPGWIGFSIRNLDNVTYGNSIFYLDELKEIIRTCRRACSSPTVLGGSGFSLAPQAAVKYLEADWGIAGEGEHTVVAFTEALDRSVSPQARPGVVSAAGDFTPAVPIDPVEWPIPARELIANDAYLALGGMGNIQAKRGCPLSCIYCTYPMLEGKQLRLRDPAAIVAEMAAMRNAFDIDYVYFVDDAFNIPSRHARLICESILNDGLDVAWTCFATPQDFDVSLAGLLKRAGCRGVEFGTDSGSAAMLARLGKSFSVDDIITASAACRRAGLPFAHYLILGGPGECRETLAETFSLMRRVDPTAVIAMAGIRIYAGTGLWRIAVEEGCIDADEPLLAPRFYVAESVRDTILDELKAEAAACPAYVVPAIHVNMSRELLRRVRAFTPRGPLWHALGGRHRARRSL